MKKLFFLCFLLASLASQAQTSLERDSLARDAVFQTRIKMALVKAAGNVLADTARTYLYDYAGAVVLEPGNQFLLTAMSYQVIQNPVITGASSDSDLEFTVNANFEKVAIEYAVLRGRSRESILKEKRQDD